MRLGAMLADDGRIKPFPPPTLEGLPAPRRNRVPKRKPRAGVDEYGRSALWNAVRDGKLEEVRRLLADHADPNASDDEGWTPLHIAAQNGGVDATKLLLEHGANPNSIDHHGNGPLWYAGNEVARINTRTQGSFDVLGLLLRAGADENFKNRYGLSVRDCAVRSAWTDILDAQKK